MKIDALNALESNVSTLAHTEKSTKDSFGTLLEKFVADVNSDLQASSKAKEALVRGDVDNMVELMTTIQKADISLRFATELRNKAIEAYQEIMRMQV